MDTKEQLLMKVGEWVSKTAEQVGDFAAREIPPFIHEYLTWKFWESAIGIFQYFICGVIWITLIIAMIRFTMSAIKNAKADRSSDWDVAALVSGIISAIMCPVFLISIFQKFPTENIKDCLQIKMAPKVYLLEKGTQIFNNIRN